MKVEYITVHDTANCATAENEIKYMISNDKEVSFHLAVDESEVIQGLPFDRNSWSCGDGGTGTLSCQRCQSVYSRTPGPTSAQASTPGGAVQREPSAAGWGRCGGAWNAPHRWSGRGFLRVPDDGAPDF